MTPPKHILPVIVVSQFFCTSLWFASNGVMNELASFFGFSTHALGHLTSSVQLGFITGTLVFALLTIPDRFKPSSVFFTSAVIGALFNAALVLQFNTLASLVVIRFLTGFFLAGIYPVGMKIAADHYEKGLGKSLGYLVGALVLGTALPHLLRGISDAIPWRLIVLSTSILAIVGGALVFMIIPEGPFRKRADKPDLTAFFRVFRNSGVRSAAFGYFGHMWELYSFWAFIPLFLAKNDAVQAAGLSISLYSFAIIGIGSAGCIIGGYLSLRYGAKRIAFTALTVSGICCLVSPFAFHSSNLFVFLGFLFLWGFTVIPDSPLFSSLVASNAKAEEKGTALTIVNSVGFAITIISIQLLTWASSRVDTSWLFLVLSIGPILGLINLSVNTKKQAV